MSKVLIIIPAYNEETRIESVIQGVISFGYDVVIVNDGSTDNTANVAAKYNKVKLINNPINLGAGAALQTGYKYALQNDYDYVINLDGDGQHDPKHIDQFLSQLTSNSADIIIGSRFLDSESYRPPFFRRIGMKFFRFVAKLVTGQNFTDTTSGYKAMTKDVIKLFASPEFPNDYPDVDTLILLYLRGFKIKEIPVKMYANNQKSMHSGIIRPMYYVFKMTLSILMIISREKIFNTKKISVQSKDAKGVSICP